MPKQKRTYDGIDLQIVQLLSEDYIPKQIGEKLNLSNRTIEGRIRELYDKMKVKGRAGIVLKGMLMGMIQNPYHLRPKLEYSNLAKPFNDEKKKYCGNCCFEIIKVREVGFEC